MAFERLKASARQWLGIKAVEGGARTVVDPLYPPPITVPQRRGNEYVTYDSQVLAIYRKYNNFEQYGCAQVKSIIDWRASQIAGNGLNVQADDEATQDFLDDFVGYNALDSYGFWELARDGEMEGRQVILTPWSEKDQMVKVRRLSYNTYKYTVQYGSDYVYPERITYTDADGRFWDLSPDQFVFIRLSGSTNTLDYTPPRITNVLYHIDGMDRALADLRKNNYLFGAPTPYIENENESDAESMRRSIFGTSRQFLWKIGTFLVGMGKFYYVEPSGKAVEVLTKEVEVLARVVSASTGIPVHFLGYVDLMSNRSTAEEMNEMINVTTAPEREMLKTKMKDVCKRAVEIYNKQTGSSLSTEGIEVTIPVVSMAQVKQLAEVYLPLYEARAISLESLRERIPGIDPLLEKDRLEEEEDDRDETALQMADSRLRETPIEFPEGRAS